MSASSMPVRLTKRNAFVGFHGDRPSHDGWSVDGDPGRGDVGTWVNRQRERLHVPWLGDGIAFGDNVEAIHGQILHHLGDTGRGPMNSDLANLGGIAEPD